MKYGLIAIVLPALMVSTGLAGEGAPSRAKLNKLGLGSMQRASDHEGSQVRGSFFYSVTYTIQSTGNAPFSTTQTYGTPLTSSPPPALPIVISNSQSGSQSVGNLTSSGSTAFTFSISNVAPVSPISPISTFISPF